MLLKSKTSACLIGCALSLNLATAAQAEGVQTAEAASTQAGMRVSVDPVTRQIRPVTAEESRALERLAAPAAAAASQRAKPVVVLTSRSTGARGVKLGEEHMSFASVARGSDGQLRMQCQEGDDHTGHAHAPVARQESNLE